MTKHSENIIGFEGSLEELAKSIGNLSYDKTSLFIEELAVEIKRQADGDLSKGRKKLANELYLTANELYKAKEKMDLAWKICKPYMKK